MNHGGPHHDILVLFAPATGFVAVPIDCTTTTSTMTISMIMECGGRIGDEEQLFREVKDSMHDLLRGK